MNRVLITGGTGFLGSNITKNILDNVSNIVIPTTDIRQKNTLFNLGNRIMDIGVEPSNDIVVEFDALKLTPQQFNYIAQLPEILSNDEELEVGEFELGIFIVNVNKIKTYEKDLIVCER